MNLLLSSLFKTAAQKLTFKKASPEMWLAALNMKMFQDYFWCLRESNVTIIEIREKDNSKI